MVSFTLPERCDRATVLTLQPELSALVGSGQIAIDATRVTNPGQALLQLLVSVRRSGDGAVITPSPALIDAAQLAGLDGALFEEIQP